MSEYLFRKGQIESHQEDGPVNGMETDNVLADQMQVSRPVFLKLLCALPVTVISDSGDIVCEGIQPHIHHVFRVKIYRDSPLKEVLDTHRS